MQTVAKFEKVSYEEFTRACAQIGLNNPKIVAAIYDAIKLPRRATSGSAGYDFFAPFDIDVPVDGPGSLIPTGIHCKLDPGYVLMLYPRSGLGFKYRMRLSNTIGVIDEDFIGSDSEGHIMAKITNEGERPLHIEQGKAFIQGVISPYFLAEEETVTATRNGGMGSTDR